MVSLRSFVVTLFLVVLVATSIFFIINEGSNEYGVNVGSNYTQSWDVINQSLANFTTEAENLAEDVKAIGEKEGIVAVGLGSSILIKVIKIPFSMIIFTNQIITEFANFLNLPPWIISGFITLILVMISYLIIDAILGRKGT